ncbi:MAG: hypothetical protein GXO79_01305 [Chlorobi bacterium]|nr:hypothetical protein [Chlorobiota bacterium]
MQCSYYYKEKDKLVLYKHNECGKTSDLELYAKSMEEAAATFDTTANCDYY